MPDYIIKRGRRYSYKRRIPDCLKSQFSGREFWQISLKTDSRKTAVVRAREYASHHDRLIAEADAQVAWDSGLRGMDFASQLRLHHAIHSGSPITADMLGKPNSPDAKISVLFRRYVDETPSLADASIKAFTIHIDRFKDVVGDLDVNAITRAEIEKFKLVVMRLPSRPSKDVQAKSTMALANWADTHPEKAKLAPKTVNAHLDTVRIVLNFAKDKTATLLDPINWKNPADGFRMNIDMKVDEEKRGFEKNEIAKAFGADYLTYAKTDARYWIPLLLYFSGARIDEISQTKVDEVDQDEDENWFITMKNLEDNERTAKTDTSSRTIPVHSDLIKLGFDRYVAKIHEKRDTEGWLFPDLNHNLGSRRYGKVATAFHRWFRKKGGSLDTLQLSCHSLRHTFTNMGLDVNNQAYVSVMQGHKVSGESLGRYGRQIYHRHDVLRNQVLNQMKFFPISVPAWS